MGHGAAMPLPLPLKKVLSPIYHGTGGRNEKYLYPDISPIRRIHGMICSVHTQPNMTDFHTSSLDSYESRINRIEPLDLPALREYVQEHAGCSWDDACDWYEQITGRSVPEEQYGEIEQVWEEESQNWEPTDDEMMGSFGTPWHDGL